jgi:amidase
VKGINSTLGYVSFIDKPPAGNNSALVEILLSLGAVLYVKTNVSQTLMTADSDNNVFGWTPNPNRLNLTAGGSSGGEGALVALRGSILGVGTDIAGSTRIPAFCTGTVGFRPTARRIPYGGQMSRSRSGGFGILPSAGPLCHSIRNAEYFIKHVLTCDTWSLDEGAIFAPWRSVSTKPKLRLGLILEDAEYPLQPSGLRNMNAATSKLSAAGHEILPLASQIASNTLAEAARVAFAIFAMDNKKVAMSHVARSGEAVVPPIPATLPAALRSFKPTIDDVWDLNVRSRKLAAEFRALVVENGLYAIVMPAYQGIAQPHDAYGGPGLHRPGKFD